MTEIWPKKSSKHKWR